MTCDLGHLRRHGLIRRQPRSNTFQLTSDGIRVAAFCAAADYIQSARIAPAS
jgi:DNA-binding IclR family transcriptional regulator